MCPHTTTYYCISRGEGLPAGGIQGILRDIPFATRSARSSSVRLFVLRGREREGGGGREGGKEGGGRERESEQGADANACTQRTRHTHTHE